MRRFLLIAMAISCVAVWGCGSSEEPPRSTLTEVEKAIILGEVEEISSPPSELGGDFRPFLRRANQRADRVKDLLDEVPSLDSSYGTAVGFLSRTDATLDELRRATTADIRELDDGIDMASGDRRVALQMLSEVLHADVECFAAMGLVTGLWLQATEPVDNLRVVLAAIDSAEVAVQETCPKTDTAREAFNRSRPGSRIDWIDLIKPDWVDAID